MPLTIRRSFASILVALGVVSGAAQAAGDNPAFRLSDTDARFYVGFDKSVFVVKGIQRVVIQPEVKRTTGAVSALSPAQLRRLNVQISTPTLDVMHGFEQLEIGRVKKVEDFQARSALNLGVQTNAGLSWGDTLLVRPSTAAGQLARTVRVIVERSLTSTGDASSLSYYRVTSSTFVNGVEVPQLQFELAKEPGGIDQAVGQIVTRYEFIADVGATFTVEGLLSILDGLAPNLLAPGSEYLKNASDGMTHTVSVQPGLGLCLRSASGRFTSGDCN
jgi:hypothetical protein